MMTTLIMGEYYIESNSLTYLKPYLPSLLAYSTPQRLLWALLSLHRGLSWDTLSLFGPIETDNSKFPLILVKNR
jgi:hypothetical protein